MPVQRLPDINYKWTSKLSYAVGLLATDGNLSKDKKTVTMRSSDVQLLEEYLKCLSFLKLTAKIAQSHNDGYAKKPSYRVQFARAQFYRWLLKVGLFPRKSLTLGLLNIPEKYFKDFLRGHLDGDGSIFTYKDRYNHYKGKTYLNTRVYTKFISASEKHIKWLFKSIKELSGINGALLHKKPDGYRAGIWEIKYAKYESLKLFKWLYYKKNLPTLKRKREIADNILYNVRSNGKMISLAYSDNEIQRTC